MDTWIFLKHAHESGRALLGSPRFLWLMILVFLFLQGSSFSQEVAGSEIAVKFGTLAPEGSIWMVRIREVLDELNQKTGNKFKVTFYPGGVLGDEPDMVRKMRLGQLNMAALTTNGIHAILPEMSVLELPFLFEDFDEVDYIREKMFPVFSRMFENKGFVLILWVDQGGFVQLYSGAPIRSPEELKMQKVWTWSGDAVALETLKALGVKPIPLQLPDVPVSLQTGLINVFFGTPLACLVLQCFTQVRYATILNLRYELGGIVVSKEFWNSVPPQLRDIAFRTIQESGEKSINAIRLASNKALLNLAREGISIISITEEEKEEFRRKAGIVYGYLADRIYPKEILDEVLKNLDEYRKFKSGKIKKEP